MDTVRQLEYVAVSRATDTATVITDMAKVEDSSLNHEANQFSKTDEHKSSVNLRISPHWYRCSGRMVPRGADAWYHL